MKANLAKIQALLARATHPATPEEEARTSAHVAVKLMAQHGVKLTLGADGEVRAVAEAEARARAAEARADRAEARARDAEARADAAETRARAAETSANDATKSEAPESGRRPRRRRAAASSAKSSNPRAGEAPAGECKGPKCQGAPAGYASCDGSARKDAGGVDDAPSSGRRGRRAYARRIEIPARYRGFCAECDGAYDVGDLISWRRGGKTYHAKCAPKHHDAAA